RDIVPLNAPGRNVIGATEAPRPGRMMGHTGPPAWALTTARAAQCHGHVEQVDPADRGTVRVGDGWERMEVRLDTIRVKGGPPVVIELKRTRHGPVFYEDTVRNLAYAMRSTMHMPGTAGYLSALRYHA